MMSRIRSCLLASVFIAASTLGAQASVTYDAVSAFSIASNPNSVWSYGYGTPGSSFTAFGSSYTNFGGNNGYNYWATSQTNVPLVGRNTQGTPSNGTYQPPSTDLWLHPGDSDSQAAILRFTAPVAGSYGLQSLFERVDTVLGGGNGVGISIYDNATAIINRFVLASTATTPTRVVGTLNLQAGDILSFIVDRNGEYSYDSTGVRVSLTGPDVVSTVPEAPSVVLLACGLLGLGLIQRRRSV